MMRKNAEGTGEKRRVGRAKVKGERMGKATGQDYSIGTPPVLTSVLLSLLIQ